MRTVIASCLSLVMVSAAASAAFAKPSAGSPIDPLPSREKTEKKTVKLADNVVVTPGTQAPAAPAAPQPTAPVVIDNANQPPRKTVVTQQQAPTNYMSTVAVSALMGGVAGALVGGAVYFLGDQNHPQNIAYWAAGGVLVGTGVGLVQVMVQESRADAAVAQNRLPSDPAPTFRVALLRTRF